MKLFHSLRRGASHQPLDPGIGRRSVVAGAGIAGVAAVAATALQGGVATAPAAAGAAAAEVPGEGYRLSEHVRRYYETTKA